MGIRVFTFIGGAEGLWRVTRNSVIAGEPLNDIPYLDIREGDLREGMGSQWRLRGVVGHLRYTCRDEKDQLASRQPPLGRPESTRAALIPIRKSAAWWELPQDERRAILEEQSEHIRIGLKFLPAVARRLHHSRDLGEPFDFLTWFEYSPGDESAFDDLVRLLRKTEEWKYVEREIDIRLTRVG